MHFNLKMHCAGSYGSRADLASSGSCHDPVFTEMSVDASCCGMQYEALGMTSHYKVFEDMF